MISIYSALNEIKGCYLEIINPLLTKGLIYLMRSFSDELRMDSYRREYFYRDEIEKMETEIPFAKHNAIANISSILRNKVVIDKLIYELGASEGNECFPDGFLDEVIHHVKRERTLSARNGMGRVRRIIEEYLKDLFSRNRGNNLRYDRLAFRIYIIIKMNGILTDDFKDGDFVK